jgi:hypothetical protein
MSNDPHEHMDESFEGFSLSEIKKRFGALGAELEGGGRRLDQIMTDAQTKQEQETTTPFFRGYNPTIRDFLARANTEEECIEIIDYCLHKGDISKEEAENYRERLTKGGPRAFGTRKPGYYDQHL